MLSSRARWLPVCLALLAACAPPAPPAEVCGNGLDDDGNGTLDCADSACSTHSSCLPGGGDGGYFGDCPKCGQSCSAQRDCLVEGFGRDRPLPQCLSGKCGMLLMGIELRVEVDTIAWAGMAYTPQSLTARFMLKKAVDGQAVSCEGVRSVASSKLAADADAIERSGRFNHLAFDVVPLQIKAGEKVGPFPLWASTGSEFLIWLELWAGRPDSNTRLPTGNRLGWGCFETGPEVAPILPEHNWLGGVQSPTSRTIKLAMPAPQ